MQERSQAILDTRAKGVGRSSYLPGGMEVVAVEWKRGGDSSTSSTEEECQVYVLAVLL
jgi:hypothetical protein